MASSFESRLGATPGEGIKAPCVAATTANITLSGTQTIDTVDVVAGDRVLVKDQTTASENGIYVAGASAWTRAKDWDADGDVAKGVLVLALGGAIPGVVYKSGYSGTFVLGTTSITFTAVWQGDLDLSTPPTDGQALVWEAASSTWKPGDAGGGGATIANGEFCPGYTFFRTTSTQIDEVTTGADTSSLFSVGKRLKITDGGVDKYGTIASVNVSGVGPYLTELTMSMEDAATIDNNPTAVCLTSSTTAWVPIATDPFGGTAVRDITSGLIGATRWWIAVGDSGKIATSTNAGVDWTLQATPDTTDLVSVAYNPDNESFLVGGKSGVVWRSTDGTAWATPTNDLSSFITDGTGAVHIVYFPTSVQWVFILQHQSSVCRSFYATDGAAITYSNGDTSISSGTATKPVFINEQAASADNVLFGLGITVAEINSPNDTIVSTPTSSLPAVALATEYVYDGADDYYLIGLANGNIQHRVKGSNTLVATDSTAFTNQVNDMAVSGVTGVSTIVAVCNGGVLGYSVFTGNISTANAYTAVTNGFSPLTNITTVHRDDTDGVFIAAADNGQICRSTNGII